MTNYMTIAQLLTLVGLASLGAAAVLARSYLRVDPGLRRAFTGLLLSAVAGVGITFARSPVEIWVLGLVMLGGIAILVCSLHLENKRKRRDLVQGESLR